MLNNILFGKKFFSFEANIIEIVRDRKKNVLNVLNDS